MSKTLITTNIASIPEVVRWKVKFVRSGCSKSIIKGVAKVGKWDFDLILQKDFLWDNTVNSIEKVYNLL
jgi:hypothetical protein